MVYDMYTYIGHLQKVNKQCNVYFVKWRRCAPATNIGPTPARTASKDFGTVSRNSFETNADVLIITRRPSLTVGLLIICDQELRFYNDKYIRTLLDSP